MVDHPAQATPEPLLAGVRSGADYLSRVISDQGRYVYLYHPVDDRDDASYGWLRHAGSDVRAARGLRGARHPPVSRARPSARSAISRRTWSTIRAGRASTSSTRTTRSSRRSAARASRSSRSRRTRRSRASGPSSRRCARSRGRSSASSTRTGTFARTRTSTDDSGKEAKARARLLPGRGGARPAAPLRDRPAACVPRLRAQGRPTGSCRSGTWTSRRTTRSTTTGSRTCSTISTASRATTRTSSTRTRSRAPS